MEKPASQSMQHCPAGHSMDPNWESCPYCEGEKNISAEQDFLKQSLRYKLIYSMTGLFLGLVCIIGGIILFLNGVAGSTSWTAKVMGNESNITDAAPGQFSLLWVYSW
jgi:hypothetical protein